MLERGEDLIKKGGRREIRWICTCDCGSNKRVLVLVYNLKNGNTTSCGCQHMLNGIKRGQEGYGVINGKKNKKYNTYDLSGEYGIGYTLNGEEFYFDLEDFDLIKNYCWYQHNGYIINKTNEEVTIMHRLIMGLEKGDKREVDHIHHKTYDNRKSELRIVTSSQNKMNKDIQSNNTSGYKGVWYSKCNEKWIAEIGVNGKSIHLGCFLNIQDAIKVRKEAEEKYFGEYNFTD